jgi:alkylation response protein AidB-like acyl-CoA dehydrogenase
MPEPHEHSGWAGADLLDGRDRTLARFCAELTGSLRAIGADLDRDPDSIGRHLDEPAVRFARFAMVPREYLPETGFPADLLASTTTCIGAVVVCERFAYGDPNVMLAGPGPSLSGGAIRALADPDQSRRYFGRLAAAPTHTFFGLTEPSKGSAVLELETRLTPAPDGEGWLLNGAKCYIGNGARAQLGVVFCRRAPGPWGIEAVLVDTADPGFSGELLPMTGLRGARISRLRFDDVRIAPNDLLGATRPASRRGLYGALQILYRFRPGIAAMALGCAQAVCDYLAEHRPVLPAWDRSRFEGVRDRVAAVRHLTYRAALDVDAGVVNAHRIGAVKAQAAQLAEEATLLAAELLGPAALVEHPWMEKTYRDVRAFELMEGTTNLHRMSVLQGLLRDDFLPPVAPGPDLAVSGAARH